MNPRKIQPVKLLIIIYCVSLISLAVRDFRYIFVEQEIYFYLTFLAPIIIAIVTFIAYLLKRYRKLIYSSMDVKELSGPELIGVVVLQALYVFSLVLVAHSVESYTQIDFILLIIISILSNSMFLVYLGIWFLNYKSRKSASTIKINRIAEITEVKNKKINFNQITDLLGFGPNLIYTEVEKGYVFDIPEDHMYADFFERIRVTYDDVYKGISLAIKLKSDSLLSLDIRKRSSIATNQRNEFSFSPLSNVYTLNSNTPEIWETLLSDPVFQQKLLLLRAFFEYFSLKGEYIEAIVYSDAAVIKLLEWIMELNPSLETVSKSIEASDADILLCYNCQDPFDPLEEQCTKCGSPRPRCIICFQDLKPEEENDVVQLPCCGIYAHRDHIMTWLKKKSICPNCHQSLSRWMNQNRMGGAF